MKIFLNSTLRAIWDFIRRHAVWILIAVVGFYIAYPNKQEIQTIAMLLRAEALALVLSGLALFAYTKIPFTKKFSYGDDDKLSSVEAHAFSRVIAAVFLGVHLLVAIYYLAVYITQFNAP